MKRQQFGRLRRQGHVDVRHEIVLVTQDFQTLDEIQPGGGAKLLHTNRFVHRRFGLGSGLEHLGRRVARLLRRAVEAGVRQRLSALAAERGLSAEDDYALAGERCQKLSLRSG
ncbi:MAG: hypothetical protein IIC25_04220 [Chloroflexi bacterium]|nr:hypothetical protein [Chloroflexota bacterium]